MSKLDMASALDLVLDDEHEAKFNALKSMHAKKLKSLMTTIDTKDKEIARLTVFTKDHHRGKMIDILKNKIKEYEYVNDIVKEELIKADPDRKMKDINDLIIRKTVDAGPKRFRPLSREELENKIIELEKKCNKLAASNSSDNKSRAANSSVQPRNVGSKDVEEKYGSRVPSSSYDKQLVEVATLVDEINECKSTITAKDKVLDELREEIVRLRSDNAKLNADEEDYEFRQEYVKVVKDENEALKLAIIDAERGMATAIETLNKEKSGSVMVLESQKSEINELQKQCKDLMKQNLGMLQTMSDLELERDATENATFVTMKKSASVEAGILTKDTTIKALEDKLRRSEEKLQKSDSRAAVLEKELTQITVLKDQLRDKNIEIKELKRNIEAAKSTHK